MVSIVEDSVANKMMSERRDLLESHFKAAEVRRPHTKEMVQLVRFQAGRGMHGCSLLPKAERLSLRTDDLAVSL